MIREIVCFLYIIVLPIYKRKPFLFRPSAKLIFASSTKILTHHLNTTNKIRTNVANSSTNLSLSSFPSGTHDSFSATNGWLHPHHTELNLHPNLEALLTIKPHLNDNNQQLKKNQINKTHINSNPKSKSPNRNNQRGNPSILSMDSDVSYQIIANKGWY